MEKQTTDIEELLSFADGASQAGTSWINQTDYVGEEDIMSDEDLAGREPLQQLRIIAETEGETKYFESLFYTGAELEDLMSELEPLFEKFPKKVLSSDQMDQKVQNTTK